MTTFERLAKKIKDDTGVEVYDLRRTYARNAKKSDAPVWIGKVRGSGLEVVSGYTATELLRAEKLKKTKGWRLSEIDINP
jgi:hypothetical protein